MSSTTLHTIQVETNGNEVLPRLTQNAKAADHSLTKFSKDANGRLRDVNGRFVKTKESSDKATNSLVRFGKSGTSSLRRVEQQATSLTSKFKSLVAGLGLTVTTGAALGGIVGIGAGFEKSMSNVQALSGATTEQMIELRQASRDAGASTAFSARESADALGFLSLAGFDANQQIAALPATLDLAAAASLDLSTSADIATNILSQFRMTAAQTGTVVDQAAFLQANFNTNVQEGAEAMKYFGPTAAAMKVSLSESGATIGLMANAGLKGTVATRALGTGMVRLAKPTKAMSDTMKQLNLNFHDTNGEFVGMANMVEQLETSFSGLTTKQQQAALSTIFGNEAIQEMNILLAAGSDQIRYWTQELENAEGTAAKIAATKLDNLAGDFVTLRSASEEITLQLYDHLQPTLRLITQEATLFVRSLDTREIGNYLSQTIKGIRTGMVFLMKHRKEIVLLGKAMLVMKASTIGYNVALKAQTALTVAHRAAVIAHTIATRGAAVATRAFNLTLSASPFGIVLAGLAAITTAMILFRDKSQEATTAQSKLNDTMEATKLIDSSVEMMRKDNELDLFKLQNRDINEQQAQSIFRNALSRRGQLENELDKVALQTRAHREAATDERARLVSERDQLRERVENPQFTAGGGAGDAIANSLVNRQYRRKQQELITFDKQTAAFGREQEQGIRAALEQVNSIITQTRNMGASEGGLLTPGPTTGGAVDPAASRMAESVVSGGARQTVINIDIEKFQDYINFNIEGEVEEIRESMDELVEEVTERFLRVVNSANQLARN
ncbi:phage tail tape measure protein [Persicobacter sp. CCB-QB2]|uniref:phage tail tape measure protein n=1 Tax=Persicobacter sp. CCB-QB2 TaxID=1561025 RepID=UPI0006A9A023|nr:phage tail tape measure protein [Persicobacter sp. CCB-QB2]